MNVGRITISRVSSSHGPDYIAMQIKADGVDVRLSMGLEAFALAITGYAAQECAIAPQRSPDKPTGTADADGPVPDEQTLTTPILVSHHREDEPR